MATNPDAALGVAPAAPAADDTNYVFELPNSNSTKINVDLTTIPQPVRMALLQSAVRSYIVNSANQANIKAGKANAPFDAYDEAIKADALQTAVAKPTGERIDPVPAVLKAAADARERLYKNEMRERGDGSGRTRVAKDPLIKLVTDAVLREVFEKNKATVTGYKWTDAVKEVGGDGVAYLNGKIDKLVTAGGDRTALEKFRDERYINPAKMMLGQKDTKGTKDQSLL